MITFFVGMAVGGVIVGYRNEIRLMISLLASELWSKVFGDKNNPSA